MATISGKWTFNDVLTLVGNMWYVDYSYSGTECYALTIGVAPPAINNLSLWYETKNIGQVQVYMEGPGWLGNYKTIDFGVTEQTVDDSFYEWLTANATKVLTIADKLAIITANEQKVYEAGLNKGGYAGGYADGYEEGKKAEYDAFWDAFQDYGKRIDYQGGFYGRGWNDSNFKPKYDMKPKNCAQMFVSSKITDLCAALDGCGVTLDTSASTRVDSMYYYSDITKVPTLDTRQAANLDSTFLESKAESVEKILLKDDGSQRFNNSFKRATALKDITFDGVIGLDINFQHSTKLSTDSIRSIIEHLSDTEPPAGQPKKTLTLSRTAVDKAFEESEGANNGSQSQEWEWYLGYKPNWDILLA